MKPGEVELWTDGSGTTRGNPGGWAWVLTAIHPQTGEVVREGAGGEPDTTNNRMELAAVIHGLKALKGRTRVRVYCDSEYVVNSMRLGWAVGWANKGWPARIKNADLFKELLELVFCHDITWHHVPGHSGLAHNERCDELAGAERRKLLHACQECGEPVGSEDPEDIYCV